ncbi:MAG TPA: phosphatase PAP2 family protein [Mycobacteriales bacterium]|nr:phosphatase PAP2 family protein [Mycobacteriales bacterium]
MVRRVPVDVAASVALLGGGAVLTALVHVPRSRAVVQRLDDRWYALVQRTRTPPHTAAARTLDVAFGTTVDWTVRALVTADLLRRRRWRALAGWAGTVVLGEVSVGPLKAAVDRIRPPEPLTRTSMMSYPSGHALAAATTAPGIVLALLPPGPQRRRGLAVAIPLAWVTALSRTSLNAHWLSDVVGGAALGTGYALVAPRLAHLGDRNHRADPDGYRSSRSR